MTLPTRNFDNRTRLIQKPLALTDRDRFDAAVGVGAQAPQQIDPASVIRFVELGCHDQNIQVAVWAGFTPRVRSEQYSPARAQSRTV
jgi:hypothetical protein